MFSRIAKYIIILPGVLFLPAGNLWKIIKIQHNLFVLPEPSFLSKEWKKLEKKHFLLHIYTDRHADFREHFHTSVEKYWITTIFLSKQFMYPWF